MVLNSERDQNLFIIHQTSVKSFVNRKECLYLGWYLLYNLRLRWYILGYRSLEWFFLQRLLVFGRIFFTEITCVLNGIYSSNCGEVQICMPSHLEFLLFRFMEMTSLMFVCPLMLVQSAITLFQIVTKLDHTEFVSWMMFYFNAWRVQLYRQT